jgi:protoporphyrinogen oxidase
MSQYDVLIVGAGVSGLVAAMHCEEAELNVAIVEATDRVGGRIKTDKVKDFWLDQGFQVLLTRYKEINRYLKLDELELGYFRPGARIFMKGSVIDAFDPLREPSKIFRAIGSKIGTLKDKWLLFRLVMKVKRMPVEKCFSEPSVSTLEYLQNKGFSDLIIDRFFRPFFGGIFLESKLDTSHRMFLFTLKMFSEGEAALPLYGIEDIPKNLLRQLKRTKIHYNSPVRSIGADSLVLNNGQKHLFKKLIVATYPEKILPEYEVLTFGYVGTGVFYFKAAKSPIGEPIIGLVPDQRKLVNNFCVLTDVSDNYSESGEALISININKFVKGIDLDDFIMIVKDEMKELIGDTVNDWQFVKHYNIRRALPVLENLKYDLTPEETRYRDNIYLAGDYLLNPSVDAAMRSGRRAAEAVIEAINRR